MAASLITITGTSGILRLDYKIGGDSFSIETSVGTFYIESTATNITYTTLTGDVIATSGSLTITELPFVCYDLFWKNILSSGYTTDALIIGTDVLTLTNIEFPNTGVALAEAINSLEDTRVKSIGFKSVYTNATGRAEGAKYDTYYLLQVVGTDIPILRVKNADSSNYIYFYGKEASSCSIPVGYTSTEPCYPILTTTTTVFAS
jgi:hypothetical protein